LEIKQLKALRAIADTGSFSEAAERLGLTQSALSHQVRHLEEELDETLLIRARPKVYPSPAGDLLLAAADRILSEMQTLEARFLKAKTGPVSGMLRLAATNMAIVYLLGDLCEAFIARYPNVELVIRATETAEEAVRRVVAGTADIAFAPFHGEKPQLTRLMLGGTEHAFIVAPSHPLAARTSVDLDDLRQHPFVLFQPGSGTRNMTDDLFLPSGGYPPILTESNDAQLTKRIVAIGTGVALMPVYTLREEARTKRLALLRYATEPLFVDFGLLQKNNVRMNAIELFKSVCLDARGPSRARIMIENAMENAFDATGAKRQRFSADPDS
jgi:DNA-binding transcriptional LysR family regulator